MDFVLGFAIAAALTLIAIMVLYPLAPYLNLIDSPGSHKTRTDETPLTGGIAILFGVAATIGILGTIVHIAFPEWPGYLLCIAILFVLGLIDDSRSSVSPGVRALTQVTVALIAALSAGEVLGQLGPLWGGSIIQTGFLAIPFTVLCFVGITNAMNLLDGADGLAGGVTLAALFWIFLFSLDTGRLALAWFCIVLAGAIVAFLLCNFDYPWRRRRVFLGSVGSIFLGFSLAWILIYLSQAPDQPLTPIAAVWIMGLPILDTVTVMMRRLIRRRHPLYGGQDHLHHFWFHAGALDWQITLVETTLAWCLGGVGFWAWRMHLPEMWFSVGFLVLALIYLAVFELLDLRLRWAKLPDRILW